MILQKGEHIIYETTGQVSWGFVILWLLTLIFIFGLVFLLIGFFLAFTKVYVTSKRVVLEAFSNKIEIYLNQIESIQQFGNNVIIIGTGGKKHKLHSIKNAEKLANILSENISK